MTLWLAIFLPLMVAADAAQLALGGKFWPMLAGNVAGLILFIGFGRWWRAR